MTYNTFKRGTCSTVGKEQNHVNVAMVLVTGLNVQITLSA